MRHEPSRLHRRSQLANDLHALPLSSSALLLLKFQDENRVPAESPLTVQELIRLLRIVEKVAAQIYRPLCVKQDVQAIIYLVIYPSKGQKQNEKRAKFKESMRFFQEDASTRRTHTVDTLKP